MNAPRRPAMLGRACELGAGVARLGGCGLGVDAFGGEINGGLCN